MKDGDIITILDIQYKVIEPNVWKNRDRIDYEFYD